MEELKKKNKTLKKIAIILIIIIILLGGLDSFLYNKMMPIIDYSKVELPKFIQIYSCFVEYEGIQKGSSIKRLLEEVIINNERHNIENKIISITGLNYKGETNKEQLNELIKTIDSDFIYEVKKYHTEDIYLDQIFIREKRRF